MIIMKTLNILVRNAQWEHAMNQQEYVMIQIVLVLVAMFMGKVAIYLVPKLDQIAQNVIEKEKNVLNVTINHGEKSVKKLVNFVQKENVILKMVYALKKMNIVKIPHIKVNIAKKNAVKCMKNV